ncbi:MAG: FxsA family protein [Actinomycetia bacterium]|nr:FxsA family protein [Actinomycetes bacterium]MCP3910174.1 FxsA family protein [Actinomycetes bacterium]MCP4084998.1 FxsA family protein [Actinomycetes bacterium]
MAGLLFLLFIVLPVVELFVVIQVAGVVGGWETIGLVILVSLIGAWLVRFEGLGVLGRLQTTLSEGRIPADELIDGALLLVGGTLMLTPGFITDGVGLFLLFPLSRIPLRKFIKKRFSAGSMGWVGTSTGGFTRVSARWGNPVTDVDGWESRQPTSGDDTRELE